MKEKEMAVTEHLQELRKSRKYIILGMATIELSFILAADILTFTVVVLPVVLIYEIAVWVIYFIERRKRLKLA